MLGFLHHFEILGHQGEVDGLHCLFLRDAAPKSWDGGEVALGYIDLLLLFHGKRLVGMILQHHYRLQLCLISFFHKIRIAHNLLRLGRV